MYWCQRGLGRGKRGRCGHFINHASTEKIVPFLQSPLGLPPIPKTHLIPLLRIPLRTHSRDWALVAQWIWKRNWGSSIIVIVACNGILGIGVGQRRYLHDRYGHFFFFFKFRINWVPFELVIFWPDFILASYLFFWLHFLYCSFHHLLFSLETLISGTMHSGFLFRVDFTLFVHAFPVGPFLFYIFMLWRIPCTLVMARVIGYFRALGVWWWTWGGRYGDYFRLYYMDTVLATLLYRVFSSLPIHIQV